MFNPIAIVIEPSLTVERTTHDRFGTNVDVDYLHMVALPCLPSPPTMDKREAAENRIR
jgi:hypothetical protein